MRMNASVFGSMLVQGTSGWLCKANLAQHPLSRGRSLQQHFGSPLESWQKTGEKPSLELLFLQTTQVQRSSDVLPALGTLGVLLPGVTYCSISYFQKCISSFWEEGNFPNSFAQLHHLDGNWATEGSSHLAEGRSALSEGGCSFPLPRRKHKSDCAMLSINSAYFFNNKL